MQKKLYVMIAAFMLMISSAVAQVTTSGMSGKVKADNEDVIGATVEAVHTPSGTRYVAVTNTKGQFNINGMRSGGPYEVTISYIGYETKKVNGVVLQLGETYNLNTTMNEDTQVLGEVVVQGKASKLNIERMGATTNITSAQMAAVPTVSRSITDMTRLSPYGGNGMTFQGSDGRTANFTVDGADFNQNFGLSDALPGGGNPISIDAIEEMQVVISPFDVRQTNFIGGGVNAITKSGTNTYKGSAYIYHKNENLRGDAVDNQQIPSAREKDRQTTYGFTLGGPIIKDKLFFFASGELVKTPTIANRWMASENGVADADNYISKCTVADLKRVSEHVKNKYGYDTGSWDSFPADEENYKILARLDWNITNDHHLALRYNHTKNTAWNAPNSTSMDGGTRSAFARMSQYSMSFANSMYSMENIVHSFSFDLNSRFGENISNQFLAT
ncbi:MAG: carboxypeptidase regulatory-like domain-containing protein, partial [Prevotellaceae bacterium]|nr:carboxypeptidase regulatory-like domain-containing protein [Prevotellaceae bacterium]MDY5210315.1 carboxypeptidase regulatory-like domain-containing protein [Prevotella sp.]